MADKSISELTAATQVGSTDLFVLEQSGVAKKLTGQILENWLVALADGHGGIQDIEKTSTSGLIDTYTITLADETVETFTVTNGKAISSVVKTGAVPPSLTDSYRINYNDGTHYDFTVTNGKGVTSIEKTSTSGLVDTYTITYNDSTNGTITVTNGKAITSITDKWAVSSSNTQTPSTWYNAAPEMTPTNRYLWHYQVIAYNDNTSVDTTKAVVGVYGDTGDAWYMWIKYAANEPTQDSDMVTIPNKWIGIYSGTSSTAPVHYTSYDWYEYKGEKGDTGDAAEVTSTAIVYQASESGTTVPTGTWVDTVPTVVQGQFLWTRVTVNWNDGTSAVWYSVSYVAIDGEGSPGSQTPLVDSGSGVVGTATAYSRQDHQHPLNVPSSGEPAMDGTASRGNADTYSRSDHVHPTDTSRARVADMAAAYSQRTYAKGELCIYENVLYRCKDGIPTAEAWNSSHWETTNIGVELGDLNGAITNNATAIRNTQSPIATNITSTTATETLKKGYFRFNRTDGRLYRILSTIQPGESIIGGSNAISTSLGLIFEGFFMGNAIIEFTGGAGWLYDDRIAGTNSAIIVQFRYENGGDSGATAGAKTFILTPQIAEAGKAAIYARNPDGTTPANMKLYCSYIISNYT